MNDLSSLKVGDEAVLHFYGWHPSWLPCRVTKITPGGRISVDKSNYTFRRKDGAHFGDTNQHSGPRLVLMTDEVRASIAEHEREQSFLGLVEQVKGHLWRRAGAELCEAVRPHFEAVVKLMGEHAK